MPLILLAQRLFVGHGFVRLSGHSVLCPDGDILSQGLVTDILIAWAKTMWDGSGWSGCGDHHRRDHLLRDFGSGRRMPPPLGSVLIPAMEKEKVRQGLRGRRGRIRLDPRSIIPPASSCVVYAVVAECSNRRPVHRRIVPGPDHGGADILIVLWGGVTERGESRVTARHFVGVPAKDLEHSWLLRSVSSWGDPHGRRDAHRSRHPRGRPTACSWL